MRGRLGLRCARVLRKSRLLTVSSRRRLGLRLGLRRYGLGLLSLSLDLLLTLEKVLLLSELFLRLLLHLGMRRLRGLLLLLLVLLKLLLLLL